MIPELNPLYKSLSEMNRRVTTKSMTISLSTVEEMAKQSDQKFTAPEFDRYVEHVKVEEMRYKEVNAYPRRHS